MTVMGAGRDGGADQINEYCGYLRLIDYVIAVILFSIWKCYITAYTIILTLCLFYDLLLSS